MTAANQLAGYASSLPNFRNRIINGNFDIWQRGTLQTSSGYGSADRWSIGHGTSSKTASQQSFVNGQTDVPNNPKYYLRHVITSSSGGYVVLSQNIEGVETLAGKTATLSFYAKADSNKNITSGFIRWYGTGGSTSGQDDGIGVTTHTLTTSWQKFTVTTTIPSISGKSIGTDGNDYLGLEFWFDAGSSLNARSNSLGNQSGTFDIAQVQLEEGTVETDFEHRPYGLELSLCQRYYQHEVPSWGTPRENDNVIHSAAYFKVSMRDTPTPTLAYNQYNQTVSLQSINKEYYVTLVEGANSSASSSLHVKYNVDAEL